MQLWSYWLETLQLALQLFSTTLGVGAGMAIVLLTIALRLALLPVSWPAAYRGCVRQKKLTKLKPELERLRKEFEGDPRELTARTLKLYRDRKVSFLEWRTFLGALMQLPVLLGMFQFLRAGAESARFLWI
jgi:YidC/Oxa1 family membrane protein insertase